ncbi:aspartyl protease family protein 1-like isoform X2 [Macadamia integrifolia]|nr:aspartyl protease family protein 1-like isoform X2 [Macadamia integrifolia]
MGDYWGYLHYASVSLGTPSISFFVALDTGSDVFWVPCDCPTCTSIPLTLDNGAVVNINYYSPKASSTSKYVPCNSSLCEQQYQCPDPNQNTCPYQVIYADQSSTSGYLVEDFLHLKTDDSHQKDVDVRITFGCSQFQTVSFAATDGLFGLGWDKLSVPSILSSAGLTANSFSMCFGSDGIGRINFGDKGSPDQPETSFILDKSNPKYTVSVTQITVGKNLMNIGFTALFDSGTSFTYLMDPTYTHLTESFNAQVQDRRHPYDPNSTFEYCYDSSSTSSGSTIPTLNLIMEGGSQFPVSYPIIGDTMSYYCLAVIKNNGSIDMNIIGQNFMTGYLIVFDRERSVLGWTQSECYGSKDSSTTATPPPETPSSPTTIPPATSAAPPPPPETPSSPTTVPPATSAAPPPPPETPSSSTIIPPATAVEPVNAPPEATTASGDNSFSSGTPPQWSPSLHPCSCCFLILLVFFTII